MCYKMWKISSDFWIFATAEERILQLSFMKIRLDGKNHKRNTIFLVFAHSIRHRSVDVKTTAWISAHVLWNVYVLKEFFKRNGLEIFHEVAVCINQWLKPAAATRAKQSLNKSAVIDELGPKVKHLSAKCYDVSCWSAKCPQDVRQMSAKYSMNFDWLTDLWRQLFVREMSARCPITLGRRLLMVDTWRTTLSRGSLWGADTWQTLGRQPRIGGSLWGADTWRTLGGHLAENPG